MLLCILSSNKYSLPYSTTIPSKTARRPLSKLTVAEIRKHTRLSRNTCIRPVKMQ